VGEEGGLDSPWDHEEQQKEEQSRKKAAGTKSARVRGERAKVRQLIIEIAFARLDPKYKHQPYSNDSIDALREEYFSALGIGGRDPRPLTPPTAEELDLFESAVNSIRQLPETDRLQALQEEYDSFLYKRGEAPQPRRSPTSEELDLMILEVNATWDLSETDRQALGRVSRERLIKGLMQLGVKGKRRAKRSRY
jgi:hypothetical protein